MRRDGDRLLDHLTQATSKVLLCAPFIKAGVLRRLLAAIDGRVRVEVVTRWHAEEVAAGVSDLEVFELVQARPGSTLRLLDNLHAKVYLADEGALVGSANLTATALGWCDQPNLELLIPASIADPDVVRCLEGLAVARAATEAERNSLQAQADAMERPAMQEGKDMDDGLAEPWLPLLGAPERLFLAYLPVTRDRLTADTLEAADHDLLALGLPAGLNDERFRTEVATRFSAMPSVSKILEAAQSDLSDSSAIELIEAVILDAETPASVRWRIVRDWLTYFLEDKYEIAPQSFITRPRPGAGR
ncbi:MAG: phospholipase D family protein [Brevundimonas sp.]